MPTIRSQVRLWPLSFAPLFLASSACSGNEAVIADRDGGSGRGGGGSGGTGGGGTAGSPTRPPEPPPPCEPSADTETRCTDGNDDDCDGQPDCLDSDCDGVSCGSDGSVCTAGGCVCDGCSLPELPPLDNVRVTMHGDTAIVEFEPVDGARDYRIYPLPDPEAVRLDDGRPVVENAIYRCGGDRPVVAREEDQIGGFDASIKVGMNVLGYERSEEEMVLGYVYLTPGPGRTPVYRVADPNGAGGFAWPYSVPPSAEYNSADYVTRTDARDALLAQGHRDDGIAFYAPDDGTRPVYRRQYEPDYWGERITYFYTEGPEYDVHAERDDSTVDFGERFRVLEAPAAGAVPLYRVFYLATNAFDVLAAGEPRFARALHQGNQPIWSLTWPGLGEKTTLVIEALDQGCPFPNGYVSSAHADGNPENGDYPSITLDEARLPDTGEVFINGQHDPSNRPRPIARSYVDAEPEPDPEMDWFEGFDIGAPWDEFELGGVPNWGVFYRRSADWAIDFGGCTENNTVGPLLGQLIFGGGDGGSSCNMSITPRNVTSELSAERFLHVRMATDLPSTLRRYPQILLTTAPIVEPGSLPDEFLVPVRNRLGPLPFEEDYVPGSGTERTIIVQTFGTQPELQVEFCDRRGWGVSIQCPRANLYGYHAGDYQAEWETPWLPVPVLGEISGHDRPVQFDVYASTERVYVFLDEKPAGCAVLPPGRMPAGPVTVVFGAVGYHLGIDEGVVPENSPHDYLRSYSLTHDDHTFDDLGISNAVAAPAWDESRLPCGTRWYGAEE
ncbi:MAG TPA: hypothetical protein VGK73_05135 [Polyangiaceae bacterium]